MSDSKQIIDGLAISGNVLWKLTQVRGQRQENMNRSLKIQKVGQVFDFRNVYYTVNFKRPVEEKKVLRSHHNGRRVTDI